MVIAADISVSEKNTSAWREGFAYKNLSAIASLYPQHQFIFIFDRSYSGGHLFKENCIPVIVGPGVNSQLMQYFWYNYKLPSLLRRYKADIFIGTNGCCSTNTLLPQCLLVSDGVFGAYRKLPGKKEARFIKKQLPIFLDKAALIIATSIFCREQAVNTLPAAAEKTMVVYPAAGIGFGPLAWEESELIKAQYTGGKEYFLHGAGISSKSQLVNLLKAFSLFKKRQKSNMQLLLAGHINLPKNDLKHTVATYKYRDDVKLVGYLSTPVFARLLASAYALVHTSTGVQLPAEAMICEVPLIAKDTALVQEICGEAALYVNTDSPEAIAEQMMLVFKDENLRNSLVTKGMKQAELYSAPAAAVKLAEAVLSTCVPRVVAGR
jgi:glycosyltransferase involved in cell wall biosynthesis